MMTYRHDVKRPINIKLMCIFDYTYRYTLDIIVTYFLVSHKYLSKADNPDYFTYEWLANLFPNNQQCTLLFLICTIYNMYKMIIITMTKERKKERERELTYEKGSFCIP